MFKLAQLIVPIKPDFGELDRDLAEVKRRLEAFGKSNTFNFRVGGSSGGSGPSGGSGGGMGGFAGNAIVGALQGTMRLGAAATVAGSAAVQSEVRRWGQATVAAIGKVANFTKVSARDTQRTEARRQAAQAAVLSDRNTARFQSAWGALRSGESSRRTLGSRIDRALPITASAAGVLGDTMGYREWGRGGTAAGKGSASGRTGLSIVAAGESATLADPLGEAARDLKEAARMLVAVAKLAAGIIVAGVMRGGPTATSATAWSAKATPAGGPGMQSLGFGPSAPPEPLGLPAPNKPKGPRRDARGRFTSNRRSGFITPEMTLGLAATPLLVVGAAIKGIAVVANSVAIPAIKAMVPALASVAGPAVRGLGAALKTTDRVLEVLVSGVKAFGSATRSIFLNARESVRQLGHDLRPLTILITTPFKIGMIAARGFFSLLTGRGGASQVERLAGSFRNLAMQSLKASGSVAKLANPLKAATHVTRPLPFGLGGSMTGPLSGQMIASTAVSLYVGSLSRAITRAAEFQEVAAQVKTVFGQMSGAVFGFADKMAAKFGTVKHDLLDAAAMFGEFGRVAGLNDRAAQEFALELTKLVPDIAAFTRKTTEEVQQALQSALRGRTMSLPPSLMFSDQDVDAQIAKMRGGKKDSEQPASSSELIRARMAVMMNRARSSGIEGYLGRTANTPMNLLRETQGRLENRSIRTGQALMPAVKQILFLWNEVVESMSAKEGIINKVLTKVAGYVASAVRFIRAAFASWNEGTELVSLWTRQKLTQAMEVIGWLPKVAGAAFAWLGTHGIKVLSISMDGIFELITGRATNLFEAVGEIVQKTLASITMGISNIFFFQERVLNNVSKKIEEMTKGLVNIKAIVKAGEEGDAKEKAAKEDEGRMGRLKDRLSRVWTEVGKFQLPELKLSTPDEPRIKALKASIEAQAANLRGEGPEGEFGARPQIPGLEVDEKSGKDKSGLGQLVDLREFRAQMQESALLEGKRKQEADVAKKRADDQAKAEAVAKEQRERQINEARRQADASEKLIGKFEGLKDSLLRGGMLGA